MGDITDYEKCVIRSWAVDSSIGVNRYSRDVGKVIKDASKISQFIEGRADAEIIEINVKKFKGGK